jgi:hypothetical protein
MLDKLRIAKYRFTLQAVERLELPPYKGTTLRGAFGNVFKRLACSQSGQVCADCLLQTTCAHAYVFETPLPADAEVLRTYQDVPHPFVLEPPLDQRTTYEPGDSLTFNLILIGRGTSYLPYFILTFQELGRLGIGRGRKEFRLKDVMAVNPASGVEALLFSGTDGGLRNEDLSIGYAEIEGKASKIPDNRLAVRFLTPTKLKHAGAYVQQPSFHVLLRSILRRVSSLYYFHCGERWQTNYRGYVDAAKEVQTVDAKTKWVDWERYSSRQKRRVAMGGFVGEVSYEGEFAKLRPLVLLGDIIHVGKATSFGQGKYEVLLEQDIQAPRG